MKCFRCGYCCTTLLVVIVIDPKKGCTEDNLKAINALEERCPHLIGDKPGRYSCAIHNESWFKETPCAQYQSHVQKCRMGEFLLEKKNVQRNSNYLRNGI